MNGRSMCHGGTGIRFRVKIMKSVRIPVTKERLDKKFFDNIQVVESGCWEWQSVIANNGYGVLQVGKNTGPSHYHESAHRYSYRLHFGEFPREMHVLHKCDNKKCVNPDHLFLGTNLDNIKDKIAKKRHKVGEQVSNSKLTEDKVREICELRTLGLSYRRIAEIFESSETNVIRICKGKSWAHVSRKVQ